MRSTSLAFALSTAGLCAVTACGGSDADSRSLFDTAPNDQATPSPSAGSPAANTPTNANGSTSPPLDPGTHANLGAVPDAGPPPVVSDAAPEAAPVDAASAPEAAPQVRNFTCGIAQCNGATDYCSMGGAGTGYQCVPFPNACASDPTCTCLQAATGAQQCNGMNGALTLTQL